MADLIKIITAIKVAVASEAQPDAQPLTRSNPTHKHPRTGVQNGVLDSAPNHELAEDKTGETTYRSNVSADRGSLQVRGGVRNDAGLLQRCAARSGACAFSGDATALCLEGRADPNVAASLKRRRA